MKVPKEEEEEDGAIIPHEIAFLERLDHECIVKYHHTIHHGGDGEVSSLAIAMELVEGNDLRYFINERHVFESHVILGIVMKALQALDYIHSKNIVHCDIKPDNIIFNPSTMEVKVVDFGFAQDFIPYMEQLGGTRVYCAPEVVVDDSESYGSHGFGIDIWALGVTIFELTTLIDFRGFDQFCFARLQPDYVTEKCKDLHPQISYILSHMMLQWNCSQRASARTILGFLEEWVELEGKKLEAL